MSTKLVSLVYIEFWTLNKYYYNNNIIMHDPIPVNPEVATQKLSMETGLINKP